MLVVKNQSGFTLVELLIGIVLMGILFAYGVPSFKDWIQNTQIRNGAEAIQNGLQLARATAVKRNTLVQLVGNNNGNSSWTISCATPIADLDGDGTADCPGTGTFPDNIQAYTSAEGAKNALVAGVNVPIVAAQPTIVFNGLGRVTPVPAADISINITNNTGGNCVAAGGSMRCLRVVVSTGGQIRMCDPAVALSAQTPQGC